MPLKFYVKLKAQKFQLVDGLTEICGSTFWSKKELKECIFIQGRSEFVQLMVARLPEEGPTDMCNCFAGIIIIMHSQAQG